MRLLLILLGPCLLLTASLLPPAAWAQPNRPQPQPVVLDPLATALLVLDLTGRCDDPNQPCSRIASRLLSVLPTFRDAGALVVYTIPLEAVGTSQGEVWSGFRPLSENEVILFPDTLDKFRGTELDDLLRTYGITTLVITGAPTNDALMYTASSAARNYGYDVVIPLDGTVAASQYEYEYAIHQLTVLPSAANRFRFTTLNQISFQ